MAGLEKGGKELLRPALIIEASSSRMAATFLFSESTAGSQVQQLHVRPFFSACSPSIQANESTRTTTSKQRFLILRRSRSRTQHLFDVRFSTACDRVEYLEHSWSLRFG